MPTVSITHVSRNPESLADASGQRGLFAWHGNHHALPLTETLGLEPGGTLRIGLLHYNTPHAVDRLLTAWQEFA